MNKLIIAALKKERKVLAAEIEMIDKILGEDDRRETGRHHTAATRRKMKLAWANRKAAKIQVAAGGQDDE